MAKKRIYAYYDGSNFYHHIKNNYGITNVNFSDMTNQLLDLNKEELLKIKYFNCPVNRQEDPQVYGDQLRFFEKIKKTPLLELLLGRLVKRPLNKMNINCQTCGHQKSDSLKCPMCKREILVSNCFKYTEKGVDVKLAINLLLDALNNRYDTALLFSSDADYVPAVKYIVKNLKKDVIYCHLPAPKTSELMQTCTSHKLITKEIVENSQITKQPKK